MTDSDIYELSTKLYQSSILMRKIDNDCANALLELSFKMISILEEARLPEYIKSQIDDIKSDILNG